MRSLTKEQQQILSALGYVQFQEMHEAKTTLVKTYPQNCSTEYNSHGDDPGRRKWSMMWSYFRFNLLHLSRAGKLARISKDVFTMVFVVFREEKERRRPMRAETFCFVTFYWLGQRHLRFAPGMSHMKSVNTKNSENQTVQVDKVQNIEEIKPGTGMYGCKNKLLKVDRSRGSRTK